MNLFEQIKEAQTGSRRAQTALFEYYRLDMLVLCISRLKNRQDAEDALMKGFYIFFDKLPGTEWDSENTVSAWITEIMEYQCNSYLKERKKNRNNKHVDESEARNITVQPEAFSNIGQQEIAACVAQLPPGYQTVYSLYELEGYSHKKIAEKLHISEQTSYSQLWKAKAMLQKMIISNENNYGQAQSK